MSKKQRVGDNAIPEEYLHLKDVAIKSGIARGNIKDVEGWFNSCLEYFNPAVVRFNPVCFMATDVKYEVVFVAEGIEYDAKATKGNISFREFSAKFRRRLVLGTGSKGRIVAFEIYKRTNPAPNGNEVYQLIVFLKYKKHARIIQCNSRSRRFNVK